MARTVSIAVAAALALAGLTVTPEESVARTVKDDMDAPITLLDERDRPAPIDYGRGPGAGKPKAQTRRPREDGARTLSLAVTTASLPPGGKTARTRGVFGPAVPWPIIPIHAVLLPDGRVLGYGTDENGKQTGQLVYDVWDPSLGTDLGAHFVLPNTTAADLFCSASSLMALGGQVLITGGDLTVAGKRNYSIPNTELFDPVGNSLSVIGPMAYPRWYPTLVALANGEHVVMGGRLEPQVAAATPEVFNVATGWRTLAAATSHDAYGGTSSAWYYPRGFLAADGKVVILNNKGHLYRLDPTGGGAVTRLAGAAPAGSFRLPAVMAAPGKVLAVRSNRKVVVLDLNTQPPTVTPTADISQDRFWSSATVMADGRVVVTGGSAVPNELSGVATHAEIWDPRTGTWTRGADAAKPRLYHSIAMLLPDATVLTAGGGAPGPIKQLNAEIYYPPYLFKSNGEPAHRPEVAVTPTSLRHGQTFTVTTRYVHAISHLTLVRLGAATHGFDADQRFFSLPIAQAAKTITATAPDDPNLLVPGYYLLFLINASGVPSVGRIVEVPVP